MQSQRSLCERSKHTQKWRRHGEGNVTISQGVLAATRGDEKEGKDSPLEPLEGEP